MADVNVAEVLAGIEMSPAETPAQLRARAAALDDDLRAAIGATARLGLEAAALRGRAAVIEHRDAARAPVAEAEDGVAAAEARYGESAAPEIEATRRSVAARQEFEAARDDLEQAQQAGAEPAELVDLDMRAMSAARVDQHEQRAVASAQAGRLAAKQDLDRARARLASARAALEAAEAAISAPLQAATRSYGERYAALLMTWPVRLAMRHEPGYELDDLDMAICTDLCRGAAETLDVVPERLARQIAAEAAAEATRSLRGMRVSVPGTTLDTTVGALVGALPGR